MSVNDDTLFNYYSTNFKLMYHFKFSLTELENMLPYERELYLQMLIAEIEKENNQREKQQNGN